jgi:hypothetical protein
MVNDGDLAIRSRVALRQPPMTRSPASRDDAPNQPHWKGETDNLPTFPEGAWSDNFAYVATILNPGYQYQVDYEGSYWNARPLNAGTVLNMNERVRVLGREGNELIVDAVDNQPSG